MLKFLTIKNYQSHQKTKLEFSPFVNVIEGESLNGKTAIIRALRWMIFNRPLGFGFHSDFAKTGETAVKGEFLDGVIVELIKDKNQASYVLNDDYEHPYLAMREGVPDLIKQALNIDEINIQKQLDPHFLITGSAGEMARQINNITNLEKVDIWVSELTTEINKQNQRLMDGKFSLKTKIENLGRFDITETLKDLNKEIQTKQNLVKKDQKTFLGLQALCDRIESKTVQIKRMERFFEIENWIVKIAQIQVKIGNLYGEIHILKSISQIHSDLEIIEDLTTRLKWLIEFKKEEEEYGRLDYFVRLIERNQKEINTTEILVQNAKEEYLEHFKENGICPVCFQKVDEKIIRRSLC